MDSDAALAQADRETQKFIDENTHSGSVTQNDAVRETVAAFLKRHLAAGGDEAKFALVTSGGTVAPLEKAEVRHVTNLSTGQRGSTSAEYFLRHGYAVLFLHKTGSLMPFARHFQDGSFLDNTQAAGEGGIEFKGNRAAQLMKAVEENEEYVNKRQAMLRVPFHTVADYQLAMKATLETCRDTLGTKLMDRLLVYLVAAVADFYVPWAELPAHKIDSRPEDSSMTIHLSKVPKALARGLVGNVWGPGAFVCTFKLETDASRVDEKVVKHINGFSNINMVAANLLQTCRKQIRLYDTRRPADPTTIDKEDGVELEQPLVEAVVAAHEDFMRGPKW